MPKGLAFPPAGDSAPTVGHDWATRVLRSDSWRGVLSGRRRAVSRPFSVTGSVTARYFGCFRRQRERAYVTGSPIPVPRGGFRAWVEAPAVVDLGPHLTPVVIRHATLGLSWTVLQLLENWTTPTYRVVIGKPGD